MSNGREFQRAFEQAYDAFDAHNLTQFNTLIKEHPVLLETHDLACIVMESRAFFTAMVSQGLDINAQEAHENTLLMVAASSRHKDAIEFLLKQGARVNAKNGSGETAFSYAVTRNDYAIAKLLYQAGADINTIDQGKATPLDWASCWADDELFTWMVSIGCIHNIGPSRDQAQAAWKDPENYEPPISWDH